MSPAVRSKTSSSKASWDFGEQFPLTYGYAFQHLSYIAIRVGAARIGSSAAESNWSVRGWLQEQRLNTRSIKLVDSLVRLHSDVINERRLGVVCGGVVQWDVECCIPEPPREEPSPHSGEPDADLDVQDDSDDEPAEPEAVVDDDDDDIAGDA
ncbi:hypothetical protein M885DRAFT_578706 [Pelagophyceae sp. CCMP2097]|nr:hypothetical protein M885DRAFT_578706 [Pelagophyceae sp. CCMP2097]